MRFECVTEGSLIKISGLELTSFSSFFWVMGWEESIFTWWSGNRPLLFFLFFSFKKLAVEI